MQKTPLLSIIRSVLIFTLFLLLFPFGTRSAEVQQKVNNATWIWSLGNFEV